MLKAYGVHTKETQLFLRELQSIGHLQSSLKNEFINGFDIILFKTLFIFREGGRERERNINVR